MIETADVIVIGGGVQGASLAFHLARRGTKVIVLERSALAAGARGGAPPREPLSGYADPTGPAAGFLSAARKLGARVLVGTRVGAVDVEGGRVVGGSTDRGRV